MKYVLLFCGSDEDAAAFQAMTPDELRARYAEVGAWFAEHAAKIGGTNQLQGVGDGDHPAPHRLAPASVRPSVLTGLPARATATAGDRYPHFDHTSRNRPTSPTRLEQFVITTGR